MASKKKIIRMTGREAEEDWEGVETKPATDIDPKAHHTDRYVLADRKNPRLDAVRKARKLAEVRKSFTGKKAKKAEKRLPPEPAPIPSPAARPALRPIPRKLPVTHPAGGTKFRSKVVKEPEMAPPPLAKIRPKRRKAVNPRKEAAARLKEEGQRSTPAERRVALAKSKRNREFDIKEPWLRKLPLDDDNR